MKMGKNQHRAQLFHFYSEYLAKTNRSIQKNSVKVSVLTIIIIIIFGDFFQFSPLSSSTLANLSKGFVSDEQTVSNSTRLHQQMPVHAAWGHSNGSDQQTLCQRQQLSVVSQQHLLLLRVSQRPAWTDCSTRSSILRKNCFSSMAGVESTRQHQRSG